MTPGQNNQVIDHNQVDPNLMQWAMRLSGRNW